MAAGVLGCPASTSIWVRNQISYQILMEKNDFCSTSQLSLCRYCISSHLCAVHDRGAVSRLVSLHYCFQLGVIEKRKTSFTACNSRFYLWVVLFFLTPFCLDMARELSHMQRCCMFNTLLLGPTWDIWSI